MERFPLEGLVEKLHIDSFGIVPSFEIQVHPTHRAHQVGPVGDVAIEVHVGCQGLVVVFRKEGFRSGEIGFGVGAEDHFGFDFDVADMVIEAQRPVGVGINH